MRSVPDWSIQVSWWISGIFATGAAWYFLSAKDYLSVGISSCLALLFAALAIALHRKKDALLLKQMPAELKDDLPADYIRRSTDHHSQVRFVLALPEFKAIAHRSSSQGWDTGVTQEMREASYDMIDFLQFAWLRLAEFYPHKHFSGMTARKYIEKYTRDRFAFHWSKHEPAGPGTGGTIVGVLTGGDVIQDLEQLIEETVHSLFFDSQTLDVQDWKNRWRTAR